MTRLILLDRDGVINFDSPEFIKSPDEWHPIPGALEAIARLKRAGFLVGVCSNQSGIARGLLTERDLAGIHHKLELALGRAGGALDDLRYCPHGPDSRCPCRKPRPGMLLDAMAQLRVEPAQTLFAGDRLRDLEAAQAAGCVAALVGAEPGGQLESEARRRGVAWIATDLAGLAARLAGDAPC